MHILDGCSIEVGKGELVGDHRPNGAGKSTLLKALFGLVKIHSGTVTLGGDDITGMKANASWRAASGSCRRPTTSSRRCRSRRTCGWGVYLRPKVFDERWSFIRDLFPVLHERRTQRAGAMSGGERQMVAMARALMMNPSVLLLDEPSAGLSPPVRQDETFLRTRMINKAGVSIIMVEQNARRCLQICDRGYVLDQGKDAYTGTGRELQSDPKVISLYLGSLAEDTK